MSSDIAEAVHPDTPAAALLEYAIGYRPTSRPWWPRCVHPPTRSCRNVPDQGAHAARPARGSGNQIYRKRSY